MKAIVLAALLLAALSSIDLAQAQTEKWFPLSNDMYVMTTKDNDKIMLSAGIDTRDNEVSFRILDLTGSACKDGVVSKPESLPPYKINGKYIRILSMCINGTHLVSPETPEGRIYLHDQIMSGNVIIIETNMGIPILHFQGELPQSFMEKLKAANRAM